MTIETERKFLLKDWPAKFRKPEGVYIKQGYIAWEDAVEVRIRQKGDGFFLAVKHGAGLQRKEWEIPLSGQQFDDLWETTEGKRLEKTRYTIRHNKIIYEIDEYHGRFKGLWVVEVEFADSSAAGRFIPPDWFGVEVTFDPRFKNRSIASRNMHLGEMAVLPDAPGGNCGIQVQTGQ